MSIEYHLYFVYFLYYVNYYNLIIIFMFMGGSMSANMLLLCYLPMTMSMIIIILPVVLYNSITYNNKSTGPAKFNIRHLKRIMGETKGNDTGNIQGHNNTHT